MGIKRIIDFHRRLKNGSEFSSKKEGFTVVENFEFAKKGEHASPLKLFLHCEFIGEVLKRHGGKCFWFVENPSPKTLVMLQETFPDCNILNGSISGYLETEQSRISEFWNLFVQVDAQTPWQNEQAWALVGVRDKLPIPQSQIWLQKPFWSVEHALENHNKLNSFFVQLGWFSFFAVRPFEGFEKLLANEFPNLNSE